MENITNPGQSNCQIDLTAKSAKDFRKVHKALRPFTILQSLAQKKIFTVFVVKKT